MICPGTDAAGTFVLAERIRDALAAIAVDWDAVAGMGHVSASIGVAAYPEYGPSADEVLLAADRACFVAKRRGRNQIATAEEGLALAGELTLSEHRRRSTRRSRPAEQPTHRGRRPPSIAGCAQSPPRRPARPALRRPRRPWADSLAACALPVLAAPARRDRPRHPDRPPGRRWAPPRATSMPSRPYPTHADPGPDVRVLRGPAGDTLIAGPALRHDTRRASPTGTGPATRRSTRSRAAYRPGRIEVGWTLAYLPGPESSTRENLPPPRPSTGHPPAGRGPPDPDALPHAPRRPDSAALVPPGPTGLDAVALTFDAAAEPGPARAGALCVTQWSQWPTPIAVAHGHRGRPRPSSGTVPPPGDAAAAAVRARLRAATTGLVPRPPTLEAGRARGRPAGRPTLGPAAASGDPRSAGGMLRPAGGGHGGRAGARAGAALRLGRDRVGRRPRRRGGAGRGGPIATDIVARVVSRARGGRVRPAAAGRGTDARRPPRDPWTRSATAGLRVASAGRGPGRTVEE